MAQNHNGFIVLDRKMLEWEWYLDIPTKVLFFHCLIKANWKDGRFMGFAVPRGSFVTSISHLASETDLSTQQVRTALSKLEATGEITKTTTNKFTIIKINNYCKYQDKQHSNNRQTTRTEHNDNAGFDDLNFAEQQTNNIQATFKQHSNNIQVTTIEQSNNINNINNHNNHTANADSGCGGDITFIFNSAFGRSPNPTEQKTVNLLVNRYGSGWVEEALTMTAEAGKDLRYTKGILCNWEERGKDAKKKQDVKKQLESERQNETDYNDIYNIYN